LEFPVVFILAVEENILPHERSLKESSLKELEEERRLLFVGMTRAEERLYLTETRVRAIRGNLLSTIPSTFLREMELVQGEIGSSYTPDWMPKTDEQTAQSDDDDSDISFEPDSFAASPGKPASEKADDGFGDDFQDADDAVPASPPRST